MNEQNVVMVSSPPGGGDGVGQYTADLCKEFDGKETVKNVYFTPSANLLTYIVAALKAAFTESDVIHVQHAYVLFGPATAMHWIFFPLLYLLTRARNQRIVITVHESLNRNLVTSPLRRTKSVYVRLVNELVTRTANEVVFLSPIAKRRFSGSVSDDHVTEMPHGSKTVEMSEHSTERAKAMFGYNSDETVIVEPGYICPRKGSHVFADLARQLPEYQFLLAGGARSERHQPYADQIESTAPENLRITGILDSETFRASFVAADLVVLPYVEAPLSGIVNKVNQSGIFNWCAAHECAVVANRNEYFQMLANEWGCVETLSPATPSKMADTVERLIENPEQRRELSRRIAEYKAANSFDRVADLHIELYQGLRGSKSDSVRVRNSPRQNQ